MLPLFVEQSVFQENLEALGVDEAWLDDLFRRRGLHRTEVLMLLYNGKEMLLIPKKAAPKGRPGKDNL